jgi:transposase
LEQDLLPKLPPQRVVIMDNAAFHKKITTQEMITQAGHTPKFLPAYSPDLNPTRVSHFEINGLEL